MPANLIAQASASAITTTKPRLFGVCSQIMKFLDSLVNQIEITLNKKLLAMVGNPVI
jgi:hypothetical protein